MQRVHGSGWLSALSFVLESLPAPIRERVAHADFLCGVDPLFVGFHGTAEHNSLDGRSYRQTAHVSYPYHQLNLSKARRRTTVVLPVRREDQDLSVIVHELGHVLHESERFSLRVQPCTEYGKRNHYEAFAEAFTAFYGFAGPYEHADEWLRKHDPKAWAFFRKLDPAGLLDRIR